MGVGEQRLTNLPNKSLRYSQARRWEQTNDGVPLKVVGILGIQGFALKLPFEVLNLALCTAFRPNDPHRYE